MQLIQHGALEVCTLRIVAIDDGNGGNPLRSRAFECIGIMLVCNDDRNFSRNFSTLNRLDNRCQIGTTSRAEYAKLFLTHQRHRP